MQTSPDLHDDWPAKATATAVGYVDRVRDATTGKALTYSRYAVYGVALVVAALVLALLALLAVLRLLVAVTGYAPFVDQGDPWLAYYVVGGLFSLAGLFVWSKAGSAD